MDWTVRRWLELQDGQWLELERGEDIDVINQAVNEQSLVRVGRILEQVKFRESNISLGSPEAREALANFHEHIKANPEIELHFCFLTNAFAGREKQAELPSGSTGIALWESIRTGTLNSRSMSTGLKHLRQILCSSKRPTKFNAATWSNWTKFAANASNADLIALIKRFEWRVAGSRSDSLVKENTQLLVAKGFAPSIEAARTIHDNLFVFVAHRLATPGVKRLSVDDRSMLLTSPAVRESLREILDLLRVSASQIDEKVTQLSSAVAKLDIKVDLIQGSAASNKQVGFEARKPDLSLPPPLPKSVERVETVDQLRKHVDAGGWLALQGGPNEGKSQLALQLAKAQFDRHAWIRGHHSMPPTDFGWLIITAVESLSEPKRKPQLTWERTFAAFGEPMVLVLDDVPKLPDGDRAFGMLHTFAFSALAHGHAIISTSHFHFPSSFTAALGHSFRELQTPRFSTAESESLFRQHEAPDEFIHSSAARFLIAITSGHPFLLTAVAEYFADRNWSRDEAAFQSLVRDGLLRIDSETIGRLVATIEADSRELLYRLSLIVGDFGLESARLLASVPPPLSRPRERLSSLVGPWLQYSATDRLAISPLAARVGTTELDEVVKRECYEQLANAELNGPELDQHSADRAILYLMSAGHHRRAVFLYWRGLQSLAKAPEARLVRTFADKWRNTPLPSTLTVGEKLFIRSQQLLAFDHLGLNFRYIAQDVAMLLGVATESDGWGVVTVAIKCISRPHLLGVRVLLDCIRAAVMLNSIVGQNGRRIRGLRRDMVDLAWLVVHQLDSVELLARWFETVDAMPAHRKRDLWESDLCKLGCRNIGTKVYLTTWERPDATEQWPRVVAAFKSFIATAVRLQQPRLVASLAQKIIEIMADTGQYSELSPVAEMVLSQFPTDPNVQFAVHGAWGRACAQHKQYNEGLMHIALALQQDHEENDHERLRCLLSANRCVDNKNLDYARKAKQLILDSQTIPAIEASRALGEYAISIALEGPSQENTAEAFNAWSEAVRMLVFVAERHHVWRDMIVVFTHFTFRLTTHALRSNRLDKSGDAELPELHKGVLITDYNAEREGYFSDDTLATLLATMHRYEQIARVPVDQWFWLKPAIDHATTTGSLSARLVISDDVIVECLSNYECTKAIEEALLSVRTTMAMMVRNSRGAASNIIGMDSIERELAELKSTQRQELVARAFVRGVIPVAMSVSNLWHDETERARKYCQEIAAFCRREHATQEKYTSAWGIAADLFAAHGSEDGSALRLIKKCKEVRGKGDAERSAVVAGYLLATATAPLTVALNLQLSCVEYLLKCYDERELLFSDVLVKYFDRFWERAIKHRRFEFRAPSAVAKSIEVASKAPLFVRIPAILSAAADGLPDHRFHDVLRQLRSAIT